MIINHNLSAINSHRVLKFQNEEVSKNMGVLSSGMRINRAADDASGLAVSEKMKRYLAGLEMIDIAERHPKFEISDEEVINMLKESEEEVYGKYDLSESRRSKEGRWP